MPSKPQQQLKPQQPKLQDLRTWFYAIIDRLHQLRPFVKRLSNEQYDRFLEALTARGGVSQGDRTVAEQWICYGKWSAAKLTGVGLELSDFFPEEITLSHAQVREMQQRLYVQAKHAAEQFLREEERRKSIKADNNDEESEFEKTISAYKNLLLEYRADRDISERVLERSERMVRRMDSENDALRSIITQKDAEMQEYLKAAQSDDAETLESLKIRVHHLKKQVQMYAHKIEELTRQNSFLKYEAKHSDNYAENSIEEETPF